MSCRTYTDRFSLTEYGHPTHVVWFELNEFEPAGRQCHLFIIINKSGRTYSNRVSIDCEAGWYQRAKGCGSKYIYVIVIVAGATIKCLLGIVDLNFFLEQS